MRKFISSRWFTAVLFIAAAFAVYFINVEVQSYLGRRALESTGLESVGLESAIAQATDEGKLILVDVSAIWCSSCRRLDREVFSDEAVKRIIRDKFVFSRLEYESEEGQAFLEQRNVDGFPNLWVLNGDGSDLRQLSVTFHPAEFSSQLREVSAQSP